MKKIISFILLFFICIVNVYAEEYKEYKSGDLVRYNDIAFYVLFDSDSSSDSVQLLKMVPLTHDEINHYTDGKAIKFNSDVYSESLRNTENYSYAYGNMAFYYDDNCYGCEYWSSFENNRCPRNNMYIGCQRNYESSNVKKVIDAWREDNINDDDIVILDDNYLSRLLRLDEVLQFDSRNNESSTMNYISEAPPWLIKLNSYGWIMPYDNEAYIIDSRYKYIQSKTVFYSGSVRPTVKLKKNVLSKIVFNEYHNNEVREYKIGDIINYNDTQFYVIKNSSESDNTITLLKNNPLHKYELEKYGEGYINNYINNYNGKNVEQGKAINDNGVYKVAYLSTDKCYSNDTTSEYVYSGCNQNYDVSNVKHIVDNWVIDTIDRDDLHVDELGYKARIINADDLTNLGYISLEANTNGKENLKPSEDTLDFMFSDNTKGMLTMIPSYAYTNYNGTTSYGIAIADDGYNFIARGIPYDSIGTVRPVVTLNKKEITPKITNVEEIEDTVSGDSSSNIEVDIETDVDNSNLKDDIKNNSLSVIIPNTLSSKSIVIIIIGSVIATISLFIFIYFKKK